MSDFREQNSQVFPLSMILFPFFENVTADFVIQFSTLFYVNSRVDTGLSSPGLFPLLDESDVPTVLFQEQKQLLDAKGRLINLIKRGNWPPDAKKYSLCKFDDIPTPYSSFASKINDPVGYPFMNIVIDDKSLGQPLNTSQMVLSAFAQLISQARYRNLDHRTSCIGIISNGYRFRFLGFQLNTLDFELQNVRNEVMNEVWFHEDVLYPENWKDLPESKRVLNPQVIKIIANILRLSYIHALRSPYFNKLEIE